MSEIIKTIGESLIGILFLIGAILSVISAFGVVRLKDIYLRSHAATKTTTLGVLSVLLAAFLYFMIFENHTSIRLLLGIVFVFITAPVAGHLIGRAAYRSGIPLWERSVQDDLKGIVQPQKRPDGE